MTPPTEMDFAVLKFEDTAESFTAICGIVGFSLTLRELAQILISEMGVPADDGGKFIARMRNFMRLGFPAIDGVKGRATYFNGPQQLEFAIAMELSNAGFTPERVIEIIQFNRVAAEKDGKNVYMIDTFTVPPIWGAGRSYKLKLKMALYWANLA